MGGGTRSWGNVGEEYAIQLLVKKGYKIIEKNFRCKIGEIDIIALSNDTLVFVEVKTRWSRKYGLPEESVTPKKLHKIKLVSEFYCQTHPNLPGKKRIDVVAIEINKGEVERFKIIKII